MRWGPRIAIVAVAAWMLTAVPSGASQVVAVDSSCTAPAGDPAFGTAAWFVRDLQNQYCATLRIRDQLTSPAFSTALDSQLPASYAASVRQQLTELDHLHGGITTLVPGATVADPFRTIDRWTGAGRGRVTPVAFTSLDGAQLRGYVFEPPAGMAPPPGGYPGIVITDGSLQGYQQLYFWAAEDLAESGYMVMTYDVQGQGSSDLLPAPCAVSNCPGVPFQQSYNFFQGAEDSLNFFAGASNPAAAALNHDRIGLAGHSLGAAAVSEVGQCDTRVKTIVAWDNLSAIADCSGVTIPAAYRTTTLLHAPALGLTNDYGFNPQPMTSVPDPHAKDAGYHQVTAANLDSMTVALRGATHLTYSYIPYVLPASELAERMASYYTLAWFDFTLRGLPDGYARLVATRFDDSVDVHSTGAGTYDLTAGNRPYVIAGLAVANATSFYYTSGYSLRDPGGVRHVCTDMRAGCP